MDHIGAVLQSSALMETSQPLQRRLSDADSVELAVLLGQMVQRYPAQDLSDSLEGYLLDFETLALKYSLAKVHEALAELRTSPGQKFFPRPDEVAEEIERQREEQNRASDRSAGERRKAESERDFWRWVDERMELSGLSEQAILDAVRVPGYMGRKARGKQ